jgi:hypothetical protein
MGCEKRNLQWEVRSKRAEVAVTRAKERLLFVDYTNKSAFDCAQEDLKKSEAELARLRRDYEATHDKPIKKLTAKEARLLQTLAKDLPRVWAAQTTNFVLKKNLLRCLINDVTLTRSDSRVSIRIRWKTMACTEMVVEMPVQVHPKRVATEVISLIKELARDHPNRQIAQALNEAGLRNSVGLLFTHKSVKRLRERYHITLRKEWLAQREDGTYSVRMVAQLLELAPETVRLCCRQGRLPARRDPSLGWGVLISRDQIAKLTAPVRCQSRFRVRERLLSFLSKDAEAPRTKQDLAAPIGVAV